MLLELLADVVLGLTLLRRDRRQRRRARAAAARRSPVLSSPSYPGGAPAPAPAARSGDGV